MDRYRKPSGSSEKFDTGTYLFFRFLLVNHHRSVPRIYQILGGFLIRHAECSTVARPPTQAVWPRAGTNGRVERQDDVSTATGRRSIMKRPVHQLVMARDGI